MSAFLAGHPRVLDALITLTALVLSYLLARVVSNVLSRLLTRAARRTASTVDDHLVQALETPLTWTLFLVGAIAARHRLVLSERWTGRVDAVVFVIGVVLVTQALWRSYGVLLKWFAARASAADATHPAIEFGPLMGKVGRVFIVTVAAITVLQHFGINVASLVVSLGVGSLAVGLAAQDTLANMFAGFTLMLDRPFRVGERVRLATGEVGDVEAIGMRATRIRTLDETILVVPNSVLVKERLVNQSQPTRAITTRLEVGVAYGSDLARTREVLAEAARACPYAEAGREPLVLVTRFGEFAVHVLLVFWARDYAEQGLALSDVHERVAAGLRAAGIDIPYPTRRIIHENAGGPAEAAAAEET